MSDNDEKEAEKQKLWKEVMDKHRASLQKESGEVHLTLDDGSEKKTEDTDTAVLKSASSALDELNAILRKQKKDLEDMHKEADAKTKITGINADLDAVEAEYKKDYGEPVRTEFDSLAVFQTAEADIRKEIVGQDEGIRALCAAFRRPYVMGHDRNKPRNVILLMGPEGTGRHAALKALAESLKRQNIFASDEVDTIDLSRYTSGAQEQIFLQDLYQALTGPAEIICFEKFEEGFPSFLRMIASLAKDGTAVLSKRYVLSRGILVENQTGLVKNAVDSLHAGDKYLVFVTHGKLSGVQDAFGADFLYHVLDTIVFVPLDDAAVKEIISRQKEALIRKAEKNLKVKLNIEEDIAAWVTAHYDKAAGADAVHALFSDFYVSLSEIKLRHDEVKEITLRCEEDTPKAFYLEESSVITRRKNAQAEIDAVNEELDQIVGLTEVKEYIRSLQAHVMVQQKRREQGLKSADVSKHMIFTGNPGTGKTTIARLLARYMKAIGALSQGQLVEVTRADLVAQYVGQTAPLTMSVIKSALGGVLFIDEAYSLYRGREDSFGLEAIDTLVKAMEDNRDDLIVILAGYKREMADFLEANSGLRSRFPNIIEFPDYTGEELEKIAEIQAKSKGYVINDDAKQPLTAYFTEVQAERAAEAGNGRLARNTVEDAILHQAERLVKEPEASIEELKKEDFAVLTETA